MSTAARKARKREQRENGTKYQHPARDGIPYGNSKLWSIDSDIADMHRQMDATRAIAEAAPDLWRGIVGR